MKNYILIISLTFLSFKLFAQVKSSSKKIYEGVFTHCEIHPIFIGENDESFLSFLLRNTNINNIEKSSPSIKRADIPLHNGTDTILVEFITDTQNKTGYDRYFVMSKLRFIKYKNKVIKNELEKVLKLSSNKWRPGLMSGRMVKSLVTLKVIYAYSRKRTKPSLSDYGDFNVKYSIEPNRIIK